MTSLARLLWQLPMAIGSYLFFKATRFYLRRIVALHFRQHAHQARDWQIFSKEFFDRRLVLPVIMVEGPRWNTHAVIARTGPFDVQRSIRINFPTAARPAGAWTIVVYRFRDHRTVAAIGWADVSSTDAWLSFPLDRGRYSLVLRYYDWSNDVELPEVWVDDARSVGSVPVPPDANEFYRDLRTRENLLYRWLHYYVYVMLLYKDYLPRRLVEKEFLPVGNPETQFLYGALPRGKGLSISLQEPLLAARVYLTLYDRASFPVWWSELDRAENEISPAIEDRMFLLRVLETDPIEEGALASGVEVRVGS